ncbi:hypothetical protein L2E82_50696 [Cichorium intybus]|nr:hypothetical protein L2E82_50696 [Cichorium intybus]
MRMPRDASTLSAVLRKKLLILKPDLLPSCSSVLFCVEVAEPLVWPSPLKFISELNQDAKALLEQALMEVNMEREKTILKNTGYSVPSPSHSDTTAMDDNISEIGIAVTVALPNELLKSAAANQAFTDNWVQSNILPYHPSTIINAIAVGNEVFVDPNNTTDFLVPAMKNVYASLLEIGLASVSRTIFPFSNPRVLHITFFSFGMLQ